MEQNRISWPESNTPQTEPVRIIIVYDNRLLREALAVAISTQGRIVRVVSCCASVREIFAADRAAHLSPNVIILGGQKSLAELYREALVLRRSFKSTKVFLINGGMKAAQQLTKAHDTESKSDLLQEASLKGLLQCILRLNGHEKVSSCREINLGSQTKTSRQYATMNTYGLTAREQEVLRLRGTGLSNKDVATALNIGVQTVKNHVRNGSIKVALISHRPIPQTPLHDLDPHNGRS